MKNSLWSLLIILVLFSFQLNAATVNSSSQTTAINFGKVVPGTTTGTITSAGVVTGGVKTLGGNANGSFLISATNTATDNSGQRIVIFLSPSPISMTGTPSGTITLEPQITSPLPSGCTVTTANTTLICTNPTNTNGNVKNWVIPLYATASAIATNQATGSYVSGNYQIVACSCCVAANNPVGCATSGCPTAPTDTARCTNATFGKTFTGKIPLRIVTALSVVAGNNLNFGSVVAGTTAGTITQAGVTTGGITAITSARSAGTFTVSGEASAGVPYTFTLPATATLTGPGTAMTANLSYSSGTGSRTLNASGQDIVTINGILSIGANQTLGSYTGTYNITVNY